MPEALVISAPRLLRGGRLTGPGAVVVDQGRIAEVLDRPPDDARRHVRLRSGVLTPGLVDLHVNGAFGVDFASASPAGWDAALRGLAARGVTAVQPTFITAPLEELRAACERYGAAARAWRPEGARLLGVHLEGPFLSPERKGAHRVEHMLDPTPAAVAELLDHAPTRGALTTVTLAPERPHGLAAVRRLAADGVVVALGHTDATADQVRAAADAGATLVTHLFNAQRPLHHRDPGVPGAALLDPRLALCLIVDGRHVHPDVVRLVLAAAPGRVVAVTDAILTAGLPAHTPLEFGGLPVANDATGLGRRPDGTIAGAGITLDEGVRRLVAAGVPPEEALSAATEAPARALGREDLGRLAPGVCADLVWWDAGFAARSTWIDGRPAGRVRPEGDVA